MIAGFGDRLAWQARRGLRTIGWPGVAGLALAVLCLGFYGEILRPLQESTADIRRDAEALHARVAARRIEAKASDPAAQLGEFYDFFPDGEAMAETLDGLFIAAAQENLSLDQGEYRLAPAAVGRLVRYDLTLPVKGPYPRLRRFLARTLHENPSLALEGVSFNRPGVIDLGVDAQVRLALYLRAAP